MPSARAQSSWPQLPDTARMTLGDEVFHYLKAGPQDAPLVLCAHGFPDLPRGFVGLMPGLVSAGYRVVAPFMRGYAPSTLRGPYGMDQIAADLCAMADALSPQRPVHLVGHDWGAAACYSAMHAAPGRFASAVTMAVPHVAAFQRNTRRSPEQQRRSRYMAYFMLPLVPELRDPRGDFRLIDTLWKRWSPSLSPDADYMRELKTCLRASFPAPIGYYRALRPSRRSLSWMRGLARHRIEVPTLYLGGAQDGCISYAVGEGQDRYFAAAFESEEVAAVGHFMQLERPDFIAGRIADWFAQYAG